MTDEKTPSNEKTLTLNKGTLSLKRPQQGTEAGTVKQTFSHGRTNQVVVERVPSRRPVITPVQTGNAPRPAANPAPAQPSAPPPRPVEVPRNLSNNEQQARAQALAEAQRNETERRAQADAESRTRAETQARAEAEARSKASEAAKPAAPVAAPAPVPTPTPAPAPVSAAAPVVSEAPKAATLEPRAAAAAPQPAPQAPAPAAPAQPQAPALQQRRDFGRGPDTRNQDRFAAPRGEGNIRNLDDIGRRPREDRPDADRSPRNDADRPQGERSYGARSDRPAGDRPSGDRPYGDRPPRPQGDRPYGDRGPRPQGDRPYGDRPPRPAGDRPQGDRPYGDRGPRPQGDRPYGDRPPRPPGDRPYGDRPPRPPGDRPYGDRPPRPPGDRPYGDRPPRPPGDRPYGDRPPRPAGDRPYGDRGPRPTGDRPGGFGDRGPRPPRAPNLSDVLPPADGPVKFGFSGARSKPAGTGGDRQEDRDAGGVRAVRRPGASKAAPAKPERAPKGGDEKRRGRLTVSSATGGEEERVRSVAAFRRRVQRMKGGGSGDQKEKIYREVTIPEAISIQELANRMSERAVDIIRMLMKQGQMAKITDVIDADTAQLIAEELGHTVKRVAESDVEEGLFDRADVEGDAVGRPPVVTIMGHVDHGKTSLLDAIRKTNVVSGEAGGITQHIGAYQVTSPLGGKITFIDTPGHAAFTAMRARGAKVTDIVVLVVAANDGVMPQTVEAINHAKAAKVPMIVAINKIDLPEASADRVRNDLLQHEVVLESLGGDTLSVELSAKTGFNLDKLLETIQLQSEVLDLKANPDRPAEGSVVEAKLDRGRGPVATVLVQRGTLKQGDIVVAGAEWGRVRALIDDHGDQTLTAGPSFPVEVLGFTGVPEAGDRLAVVENEARAREVTDYRIRQKREKAAVGGGGGTTRSLVDMLSALKASAGKKEFPLVIKGDVQGSVEAISGSLEKLGTDEVIARVLHTGVGGISESDVTLANTTGAVILAFNVRANKEAREMAERNGVEIRYYSIIYDLVDDVKAAMSGLLAPTLRETMLGNAEIKEVFNITKIGKVAGCIITDGKVERGAKVRLIRDKVVIHEGTLKTLKRFKDEVKEVQTGQECGMAFENYDDIRAGDIIECFRVEEIKRSL
jgi:translation initiation factor IF-2